MKIIRDLVIAIVLALVAVFLLAYVRGLDESTQGSITETEEEVVVIEEEFGFSTGVAGIVLVISGCPVSGPGVDCQISELPYEGIVDMVVSDPERELIARVRTDNDGRFGATLPAGEYAVVVQTGGQLPLCPEEVVAVSEGQVTEVSVRCDSGVR